MPIHLSSDLSNATLKTEERCIHMLQNKFLDGLGPHTLFRGKTPRLTYRCRRQCLGLIVCGIVQNFLKNREHWFISFLCCGDEHIEIKMCMDPCCLLRGASQRQVPVTTQAHPHGNGLREHLRSAGTRGQFTGTSVMQAGNSPPYFQDA